MSFEFTWLYYIFVFSFIDCISAQAYTPGSYNIRRSNLFDYSFDDWETSTQSVYDIVNYTESTNSTSVSSTATTTTAATIPITTSQATVRTSVIVDSQTPTEQTITVNTLTTESYINDTITSVPVTTTLNATEPSIEETTHATETTTIESSSIAALNDTDLDELLYNYLTTTHQAGLLITPDISVENASQAAPPSSTVHPIVWEVKDLTESLKYGFFTTTMISLTRVVAAKDEDSLHLLLTALNTEVMRLNTANRFSMFGPVATYTIEAMAQMMVLTAPDVVQSQASLLNFALTTRKSTLNPEVNAIFDLVDNIYTDEDALNVITCIVNVNDFPNTTKNEHEICEDLIEAVLFIPHSKIKGTHKEQLLMLEIENLISKNVNINPGAMPRRMGVHTFIPVESFFRGHQWKPQKRLRKPLRSRQATRSIRNYKNFRFAATTEFVVTDLSYFRNESINKMLKKKQRHYKKKWKKIRESERIIGTKRGKTTTTTTTTTTIKPTMHRSKYYWRKHVFRNLYKMKTTTKRTTTTKLYPWMRRYYGDRQDESTSCSSDTDDTSSCDDDVDDSCIHTNEDTSSSRHTIIKDNFTVNSNENRNEYRKSLYKNYHDRNKNIEYETTVQKPMMVFRGNLIKTTHIVDKESNNFKKIHENSDDNSDEKYLKANVLDALVHGQDRGLEVYRDKRRHIVRKVDTDVSYSNEEAILKAQVYKAFGYANNFADNVKKYKF